LDLHVVPAAQQKDIKHSIFPRAVVLERLRTSLTFAFLPASMMFLFRAEIVSFETPLNFDLSKQNEVLLQENLGKK